LTDQLPIGVVPGGPNAVEVLVPGFQGIPGQPGVLGTAGRLWIFDNVADLLAVDPGVMNVDDAGLVVDSTGLEDETGIVQGMPLDLVGAPDLWVVLEWRDNSQDWVYGFRFCATPAGTELSPLHTGAAPPDDSFLQPFWYDVNVGRLKIEYDSGSGPEWIDASPAIEPVPGDSLPAGTILFDAAPVPPAGWLRCDGAEVSRITYAGLFARIGTTYGAGNGSTTFLLPDGQGRFARGHDFAGGLDPARVFGSVQADEVKSHTHATVAGTANLALGQYTVSTVTPSTIGGTETRPANISLSMIIKT
jgi:microcystin-dependent protein